MSFSYSANLVCAFHVCSAAKCIYHEQVHIWTILETLDFDLIYYGRDSWSHTQIALAVLPCANISLTQSLFPPTSFNAPYHKSVPHHGPSSLCPSFSVFSSNHPPHFVRDCSDQFYPKTQIISNQKGTYQFPSSLFNPPPSPKTPDPSQLSPQTSSTTPQRLSKVQPPLPRPYSH